VVAWVRGLVAQGPPQLPNWLRELPFVGPKLATFWDDLVASGVVGLEAKIAPYVSVVTSWVVSQAGVLGALTLPIVQAVVGGIGLAIAGVSFAALLTAVMFMLCIIQVGPTLVLLPATIWVFWSGDTGWGIFLAVWTLVVGTMDNFLRPWLIKRGADLPLLLIFAGVIGGLLAFGLVGIFVGPVMLAVSYTLIDAWLQDADEPATPDQP
jgi:predicted PurR-regulated permease PerM